MVDFVGYHGTTENVFCNRIIKEGFQPKVNTSIIPGDLGRGSYFFIKKSSSDDPLDNAYKYVKKYKYREQNHIVLSAKIESKRDNILDLNSQDNIDVFLDFREKNIKIIREETQRFANNNSKHRGNFDGIVLEVLLRSHDIAPHVIIKDTYTAFYKIDGYRQSSFFNTRELCVRNHKAIKKVCKVK